jgi:hypothetical protein
LVIIGDRQDIWSDPQKVVLKIQSQFKIVSNHDAIDHGKRLQQRQLVLLGDRRSPLLVRPQDFV